MAAGFIESGYAPSCFIEQVLCVMEMNNTEHKSTVFNGSRYCAVYK